MEASKFMDSKSGTSFEDVTEKRAKAFDSDANRGTVLQNDTGGIPQPVPRVDREQRELDLDSIQYVRDFKGDYNVLVPVDEYLDREAMKLGYGGYDEMLEQGLSLAVPPLVDRHGMPIEEVHQKTDDISEKAHTTSPARQIEAENTDGEEMVVAPKNASDDYGDDEKLSALFGNGVEEKLFRDKENGKGHESDAYVYYDYKKGNKSDATERESGGGHDKQALKKSETSAGGGATFTASYSRNGTLKTDIKLNTGRNRTDSKGFVDKSLDFASKTERFVSMIPKDELMFDDAVDVTAISALEHSASKHMEKKSRYKAIRKEAHRNAKSIRKEIAADESFQEVLPGGNLEKAINSETLRQDEEAKKSLSDKSTDTSKELFNESNLKFTDETDRFSDPMEKRFTESVKYTDSLSDSENNPGKKEESFAAAEENVSRQVKTESDVNREFANKSAFDQENSESGTSGKNRSVDSYFNDDTSSGNSGSGSSSRFMTKEERLEQEKSKEKSAKKSEKKEVRKAATRAAVAKLIEAHKNLKSEIGDMSGQSSGDLLKDGTGGLLKTAASAMKNLAASAVKGMIHLLLSLLGTLLSALAGPLCIILLIVFIVFGLIAAIGSMLDFNSDSGTKNVNVELEYDDDYEADVEDDISTIMSELNANYPLMSYGQETAVWYALSKVGSAHDQTYHTEMIEDVFDSSSLAYRAYWYAGMDISYGGNYSAASEAEELILRGRDVTDGTLRPGDLLFYGGSDNGKFAGIFHVAIYVGNINGEDKMVEARNDDTGVVYCDMRMENLVVVARPCDELPPPEEILE